MPGSDEIVEFGPFRLHVAGRLLQRNGVAVKLGSRSLDLLIALVERAGDVLSQRELIARAWSGLVVEEANLRVAIASLRKCLGEGKDGARYIVNIPGRGYSFVAPVARAQIESSSRELEATRSLDPRSGGQRPASAPEHSLPERLGRLIGRDTSVRALVELLTKHRFVSIIGPGGMGKTTVAISVAHTLLDTFGGAVYYVDLASVTDASLVPATIASVLGLKVQVQDPSRASWRFFAPEERCSYWTIASTSSTRPRLSRNGFINPRLKLTCLRPVASCCVSRASTSTSFHRSTFRRSAMA